MVEMSKKWFCAPRGLGGTGLLNSSVYHTIVYWSRSDVIEATESSIFKRGVAFSSSDHLNGFLRKQVVVDLKTFPPKFE